MLKPICVKCQRFYRPHRNGRIFVEGMPKNNRAEPGTSEPEKWKPYKVWVGDEWLCFGCGSLIIVGVAPTPIKESYHDGFDEAVALGSYLRVNDC